MWPDKTVPVVVIAKDIEGDKFWCHAHKSWIDDMRADYEKMLEKENG